MCHDESRRRTHHVDTLDDQLITPPECLQHRPLLALKFPTRDLNLQGITAWNETVFKRTEKRQGMVGKVT